MKTAWNNEIFQVFEELSVNEGTAIAGGETLWYWVGYSALLVGYMFTHLNSKQSSGQQLMNVALG
jgi:hypothetical protein